MNIHLIILALVLLPLHGLYSRNGVDLDEKLRIIEDIPKLVEHIYDQSNKSHLILVNIAANGVRGEVGGYYDVDKQKFIKDEAMKKGTYCSGKLTVIYDGKNIYTSNQKQISYDVNIGEIISPRSEAGKIFSPYLSNGGMALIEIKGEGLPKDFSTFPKTMLFPNEWNKSVLSTLEAATNIGVQNSVDEAVDSQNPLMQALHAVAMINSESFSPGAAESEIIHANEYVRSMVVAHYLSDDDVKVQNETVQIIKKLLKRNKDFLEDFSIAFLLAVIKNRIIDKNKWEMKEILLNTDGIDALNAIRLRLNNIPK